MDKLEREFKNEISTGQLARARSFLTYTVIWDIDKKDSIINLVRIAESNNIFEELVGELKKLPESQWNENYQDSVQTDLMLNYSKKRFLYFLEVAEYLSNEGKQKAAEENKFNENNVRVYEVEKPLKKSSDANKFKESRRKNSEECKKKQKLVFSAMVGIVLLIIVFALKKSL